jgi:Leucine-rich repeat (LRR) protein
LEVFELTGRCFKLLPTSSIDNITNLRVLNLGSAVELLELPDVIRNLTSLECLILDRIRMRSLPAAIDPLANLKEIALMGIHLSELPEEIGNLTNLKSFKNLTHAEFFSLPASVGNLTKPKELDLSRSSRLDDLPEEIGNLVFLETLRLRASGLPSLPNSICDLINLKELDPQHCQSRILDFGWFTVMSRMNPRRRPSRICRIVFHRKSLVPR